MTTRQTLFTVFFFTFLCTMIGLAGALLAPFFGPLLLSAVLAIVFYPLHQWIGRRRFFQKRPNAHALASDLLVVFLFVIPFAILIWALVAQFDSFSALIQQAVKKATAWFRHGHQLPGFLINHLPDRLSQLLTQQMGALPEVFERGAGLSMGAAAKIGAEAAKNTISFLIGFVLLVFALFFMFRDGAAFYAEWNRLLPMPAQAKKRLDLKIYSTIIGVVRGTFITALAQTAVAVIGFLIVRAPAVLLLGMATFMATIIPGIGSALVWAPVSVYYLVTGAYFKGVFLIGWGVFVTGLIDNVLRPYVVGKKMDISIFWLVFGILGGLQIFGVAGILLGPLIMVILPILLDIYRESYLNDRMPRDE